MLLLQEKRYTECLYADGRDPVRVKKLMVKGEDAKGRELTAGATRLSRM